MGNISGVDRIWTESRTELWVIFFYIGASLDMTLIGLEIRKRLDKTTTEQNRSR